MEFLRANKKKKEGPERKVGKVCLAGPRWILDKPCQEWSVGAEPRVRPEHHRCNSQNDYNNNNDNKLKIKGRERGCWNIKRTLEGARMGE